MIKFHLETLEEIPVERVMKLLKRLKWNRMKVLANVRKNKGYYRKFFGGECGQYTLKTNIDEIKKNDL